MKTPETDEMHGKYSHDGALNGFVPMPFAQKIERERDEARLEAERMSEKLNNLLRNQLQRWRVRDKFSWETGKDHRS